MQKCQSERASNSSAQNSTQNAEKTGRKLGNQVIRKGYMSIHNLGIMKGESFKENSSMIKLMILCHFIHHTTAKCENFYVACFKNLNQFLGAPSWMDIGLKISC